MSRKHETPIDPREWEAQERGMRAALGRDLPGTDAVTANYRIVAEALAAMPRTDPPPGFAADVAGRVARDAAGLERVLSWVLLFVFLIAMVVVAAQYGPPWWQSLRGAFSADAMTWMLAGLGCVVASWAGSRWHELSRQPEDARLAD